MKNRTVVYLSPDVPRWEPRSEAELHVAIASGLLEENHFLDLKREVPSGKSGNAELARDLVQFAIDGGAVLIGVDEKGGPSDEPALTPTPLKGLAERIEQIARSTPDPPLEVTCRVIQSDADPTLGYVLVRVPISRVGLHMVNHVYFGRGDKTKYRLSDPEVRRRLKDYELDLRAAEAELDNYVGRDPIVRSSVGEPPVRLFLTAVPLANRTPLLGDLLSGSDYHGLVYSLIESVGEADKSNLHGFFRTTREATPSYDKLSSPARRTDGVAASFGLSVERDLGNGDPVAQLPWAVGEVEFSYDGHVRAMAAPFSYVRRDQVLVDSAGIARFTRLFPGLVESVANISGYTGSWLLGMSVGGLAGLRADIAPYSVPYENDRYQMTAAATLEEIQRTPGKVTRRLSERLFLALDVADQHERFLTDQ